MEFFVKPGTDEEWHERWIKQRVRLVPSTSGIAPRQPAACTSTRRRSCSHYSKRTVDIEYRFDFAGSEWGELEGIANRTDFDLSTHAGALRPGHVLPGRGVGRAVHPVRHRARRRAWTGRCWRSCSTPTPRTRRPTPRATWRSGPCCGSITGSPRSRSPCCRCRATRTCPRRPGTLAARLRKNWNTEFDDAGAIGRRYRRQDEIGTPVLRDGRLRDARGPGGRRCGSATRWSRSESASTPLPSYLGDRA